MKKLSIGLLSLLLIACSSGSSQVNESQKSENSELKVATVIYPNKYLLENLLNQSVLSLSGDKHIHEFKPSAKEISDLFNMDLIVIQSRNLETFVWELKDQLEEKNVYLLELEPNGNYHTWLDPVKTLENIDVIKNTILELNPNLESEIDENYEILKDKISNIELSYSQNLVNCELDHVLVSHNFIDPVANSYGFKVDSLVNEDHFVGFSAKKFVETMKSKHEYILSEPQYKHDIEEVLGENHEDEHHEDEHHEDEHHEDEHHEGEHHEDEHHEDGHHGHGHASAEDVLGEDLANFEVLEIIPIEDSKVEYIDALEQNLKTLKTALKCQK